MKIEYTLLVLALALVYGIVKQFLPDFPLDEQTLLTFIIYVLAKLGVEVASVKVRGYLVKRKFMKAGK